ncbi:proline-rich receptor-like protein kinase PERK2 [Iris pallida]|uniref:Proline-rich receptor-like protein kinase PERK2 n=1 Tax=Iris pallida TaxID=29817 RepID=A0AAX6HUX1_IRIPA|nr:proline-rich receptor-like protein kinase PERK2 [Iris pallida]
MPAPGTSVPLPFSSTATCPSSAASVTLRAVPPYTRAHLPQQPPRPSSRGRRLTTLVSPLLAASFSGARPFSLRRPTQVPGYSY